MEDTDIQYCFFLGLGLDIRNAIQRSAVASEGKAVVYFEGGPSVNLIRLKRRFHGMSSLDELRGMISTAEIWSMRTMCMLSSD